MNNVIFNTESMPIESFTYYGVPFRSYLNETFFYENKTQNASLHSYIEDTIFKGNEGRAISVLDSYRSILVVNNSQIVGNLALNDKSTTFRIEGGAFNGTGLWFSHNNVSYGGALYATNDAIVRLN